VNPSHENETSALISIDNLPEHAHLEAEHTRYCDVIRIRAVDDTTGSASPWSIVPIQDGCIDVVYDDLWLPIEDAADTVGDTVPFPRQPRGQ
jgi:hypothetical protein